MRVTRLLLALATLLVLGGHPRADEPPPKAALCAACHGTDGKPTNAQAPVIWGQNEGYLYLQLRDYKSGSRQNQVMGAIAGTLEKQEMKDLAAYFASLQWPDLQQPAAPQDVAQRAEQMNSSAGCKGCHLGNWQGDGATPRIGGQRLDYLRATMTAFRDGSRGNNPWMSALLKTFSDADIDAMAHYLAGQ